MKHILIIFAAAILILISAPNFVFAQTNQNSAQNNQQSNSVSLNSGNNPDAPIQAVKSFINGFSDMLGGFVFYTPDVFSSPITLKDGTQLSGLQHFRDMFFALSIPIVAIIVSFVALRKISSDQPGFLKPFLMRLLIMASLFIITPTILSMSIQGNNLLVNQIQNQDTYGAFINEYLNKVSTQVHQGQDPSQFAFFNFNSIASFLVQGFLFVITFLFFLAGFLFIGFQFVIRFASLLFLSVLFPIVIPFVLSEKTEGIVHTYFRSWFTFLIHQAAFVLGYVLVIGLFRDMMQKNGASLGILFLYTGFLFFLGGVNVIVARIFGESWVALATNISAAVGNYETRAITVGKLNQFKQGFLGGQLQGVSGYLGRRLGTKMLPATVGGGVIAATRTKNNEGGNEGGSTSGANSSVPKSSKISSSVSSTPAKTPPYTAELNTKGLKATVENQKQGVVTVSGEGYQYTDKKSGLSSIYPTKSDALTDGVKEEKLQPIKLNDDRFIDLSSFGKNNPNPHNTYVTNEAKKKKLPASYAHLTHTSDPGRVNNFLTLAQERNEPLGIKGVIVKRFGSKNQNERVIRMYTKEPKS